MMELKKFFEAKKPTDIAKARNKRQDTSTRDKKIFLAKIAEIEKVVEYFGVEIKIKSK
jgi:hypothetical protein